MHVQNLMNSLWDIRIFLGLVPKESPCIRTHRNVYKSCKPFASIQASTHWRHLGALRGSWVLGYDVKYLITIERVFCHSISSFFFSFCIEVYIFKCIMTRTFTSYDAPWTLPPGTEVSLFSPQPSDREGSKCVRDKVSVLFRLLRVLHWEKGS